MNFIQNINPTTLKPISVLLPVFILVATSTFAQTKGDSVFIQSKEWYRDNHHEIQYKDWKYFGCKTVDLLKGFTISGVAERDKFGGNSSYSFKATGFFYTEKKGDRYWIIDPEGHPFYNIAMNAVRVGKAPSNEKAFDEKFKTKEIWISETQKLFSNNGFNTAGSWSDIETIKSFNNFIPKPIVYTTQLSLLGSFSQKKKKKSLRKDYPALANIFNPDFKTYCYEKTRDIITMNNDKNLFGHFSDNELPFQENLITAFLDINDIADVAYQTANKWVMDKKIDTANITKEQKEEFSGYVANEYYKICSEAIKSNDPNHLYLGSRLHSSAKSNDYILDAAEKYLDIISINFYGEWAATSKQKAQWSKLKRPFIITEFYTKAEDSKMGNVTGAGWLVKTQEDRGFHYQNFCLNLLQIKNCVGWHWFRYQDNAPDDAGADFSNKDSNKGILNTNYEPYTPLLEKMKQVNDNVYGLIKYFDN